MAFLIGVAQEQGYLNIDSATNKYLGNGWTSCSPNQEIAIKLKHQISMCTGLEDELPPSATYPDPKNCTQPGCLVYRTAPNTRWAYFNGPYRLTQDVLENATGMNKNVYTNSVLGQIGWSGFWYNYVLFGKARDMARFGLLMLNKGKWNNTSILSDTNYFNDMINTSQIMNPSYGYLWWLNGKGTYKLPQVNLTFQGNLIPNAPNDMYAALGKDDQKIYVCPSLNMVVIRQGNAADSVNFALSTFDNDLWGKIMNLGNCSSSVDKVTYNKRIAIYPNPTKDFILLENNYLNNNIEIFSLNGKCVKKLTTSTKKINISGLSKGMYYIKFLNNNINYYGKFIVE